jgi:hypothetical protein
MYAKAAVGFFLPQGLMPFRVEGQDERIFMAIHPLLQSL